MAYAEITVGSAWMIVGVLMVYAGLYNRNPVPARIGAVLQVPVVMAGAGAWLVRTGIRLSLWAVRRRPRRLDRESDSLHRDGVSGGAA